MEKQFVKMLNLINIVMAISDMIKQWKIKTLKMLKTIALKSIKP